MSQLSLSVSYFCPSPSLALTLLYLTDQATASCSVFLSVHLLWSVSSSHVFLPVLPLPSLLLLRPYASLKAELFYLSRLSRSLLYPSPILIFSCSASCVFKVQKPPREQEKSVHGLE